MEVREDDEEFKNRVDLLMEDLERRKPGHFATRQYANSNSLREMYALSDFLIMVFVMVSEQSLRAFSFQEVQHEERENHPSV